VGKRPRILARERHRVRPTVPAYDPRFMWDDTRRQRAHARWGHVAPSSRVTTEKIISSHCKEQKGYFSHNSKVTPATHRLAVTSPKNFALLRQVVRGTNRLANSADRLFVIVLNLGIGDEHGGDDLVADFKNSGREHGPNSSPLAPHSVRAGSFRQSGGRRQGERGAGSEGAYSADVL
jgi:hypothetical protein